MSKGVSIIICCYNTGEKISTTLNFIAKQNLINSIDIDLILVNNNSSDLTVEWASETWKTLNVSFPLRIVNEYKQGLIYARKKGILSAKYETIIFCDDDNWLDSNYCQIAFDSINANSLIGAFGGAGMPVSDIDLPNWFHKVQNDYACGTQMMNSGDATTKGFLWGAGLVSRKSILENVFNDNFPFILTGRKGKQLSAGDDTEICKRILLMGYKLEYNSNLKYYHFIEKKRLRITYYKNMVNGFKKSQKSLIIYDKILNDDLVLFHLDKVINYIYIRLFKQNKMGKVNYIKFYFYLIFSKTFREKYRQVIRLRVYYLDFFNNSIL